MARPDAVIKLLYYPTPITVMQAIARYIKTESRWSRKAIVDTSAGTGEAAKVLADAWGMDLHGVELDPDRAAELAKVAKVSFCGSYSQIVVGAKNKYSVLFLNPPYDYARIDDYTVERQEVQFLAAALPLLSAGALVVFVPPSSLLQREEFRRFVQDHLRDVEFFRFPPDEFKAFGQVVMIAEVGTRWASSDPAEREATWRKVTNLDTMAVIGEFAPKVVKVGAVAQEYDGRRLYYQTGGCAEDIKVSMTEVDPAQLCPRRGSKATGAWATRSWSLLTTRIGGGDNAPLAAPRPGHQAMLLAAGALNGVLLDGRYLVKGGSEKQVVTKGLEDGGEEATERIVSHLSVLDLATGDLDTWNVGEKPEKTAKWFTQHSEGLALAIQASHTPQFDGDTSRYDATIAGLRPPGKLPGRDVPAWIDGQVQAACACVHRWRKHKNVILSGECGTGKTSMSIIATEAAGHRKTIVVCPAHLVPKWCREVYKITGEDCARVGTYLSDIDAFFNDDEARYLVVSKERAKLGSRWAPTCDVSLRVRREYIYAQDRQPGRKDQEYQHIAHRGVLVCPECGARVEELSNKVKTHCEAKLDPKTRRPYGVLDDKSDAIMCGSALWSAVPLSVKSRPKPKKSKAKKSSDRVMLRAGLEAGFFDGSQGEECRPMPKGTERVGYEAGWRLGNLQRRLGPVAFTHSEGAIPPHQVAENARWDIPQQTPVATRRWPLAAYAAHRHARRYSLVVDECHQYAGGDTDQSRAIQNLLSSAVKTLMMTGTLYGGRASSIFHLLYKCEPSFRAMFRFDEAKRFSQLHGLFTRVFSEEQVNSRAGYKRGNGGGKLKEIPGMSPHMTPMLLPYVVFVKLADLASDILPPYKEEMVYVEPDKRVAAAANKMQEAVKAVVRKYPQVLGAYLMACLGYPDRPDQPEEIRARIYRDPDDPDCKEFRDELVATAPAITDARNPKDDWVVERVALEKAEGRRVLVYTTQNKRRDVRGRLRAALEAKGYTVAVLGANVAPDKREAWLDKARSKGFDVLITNGALVETGLDLLDCPTIIQYGTEYSINRLRQSLRRSWRLGQRFDVRVFMLAQRGTMQDYATGLIAAKLQAAEMVDGDEAGGLAQVSSGGANFLFELASRAIAGLT